MSTILKAKGATNEQKFAAYAAMMYKKTFLTNKVALEKFLASPNLKKMMKDPAIQTALAFLSNYNDKYKSFADAFQLSVAKEGKAYVKGLMEMQPDRMFYPDANSTMRTTYGNVKSYDPKDAIHYHYLTNLSGIIQKEIVGDPEFEVPEKLKELYKNKDFGQHTDATGEVPVAFITTNDITGGNSGSPVIDGEGNLIGTAFDGNWEAMSGDIAFDKDLKRTICVDVRYVMFIIDKFGGAKNLINEMTLVK